MNARWAIAALVILANCADSESDVAAPDAAPAQSFPDPDAASTDAGCGDACTELPVPCAKGTFCPVPTGVSTFDTLTAVWGSSKSDVWAVGSGGTIIHWDGAAWSSTPSGVQHTLYAVRGTGPSDVWAVSASDAVLHSNGTTWTRVAGPANPNPSEDPNPPNDFATFFAVAVTEAGALRVAGQRSVVGFPGGSGIQYRVQLGDAGATWETTEIEHGPAQGMWALSPSDLWLVGADEKAGYAVHATHGASWTFEPRDLQSTAAMHAVWASGPDDVWVVGDGGTLRHLGATRFEIAASPTTAALRAVWGTAPANAYAVGDAGTILHFDGANWKPVVLSVPAGSRPSLRGVWASGPDDVWAVGDGVALHLEPGDSP